MPLLESEPRPELNSDLEAANVSPGPEPSGPYETGTRISKADQHPPSERARTDAAGPDSSPLNTASAPHQQSVSALNPPDALASELRGTGQSLEFSYDSFDIVPSWEMWGPYSAESASRINVVRESEQPAETLAVNAHSHSGELVPAPMAGADWSAAWSAEPSPTDLVTAGQPANAQDLVRPAEVDVEFSPQPALVASSPSVEPERPEEEPTAIASESALPSTSAGEEPVQTIPSDSSPLDISRELLSEESAQLERSATLAREHATAEVTTEAGCASEAVAAEVASPEPPQERTEPLPERTSSLASPSEETASTALGESLARAEAGAEQLPATTTVSLDLERDIDWEEAGRISKPFGAFPQVSGASSVPEAQAVATSLRAGGANAGASPPPEPTSVAGEVAPISSIRSKPPSPEERRSQLPRTRTPRGERSPRSDKSERLSPQPALRRPRSFAAPAREPAEAVAAAKPPTAQRASLAQSARLLGALVLGVGIGFGLGQLVAREPAEKQPPADAAPALDIRSIQGESESNSAPAGIAPAPAPSQPSEALSAEPQAAAPPPAGPSDVPERQPTPDSEPTREDDLHGVVGSATDASHPGGRRSAALFTAPAARQPSASSQAKVPKRGEPASSPALVAPAPSATEPEASEGKQPVDEPAEAGSAASAAKLLAARAPFDPKVANSALAKAASGFGACVKNGESGGVAVVTVTFSPSGKVSLTQVAGSRFAGTPAADCISAAARNAQIPPFLGKPVSVKKSFVVE